MDSQTDYKPGDTLRFPCVLLIANSRKPSSDSANLYCITFTQLLLFKTPGWS